MSAPTTAGPRAAASVIELEIAAESGPGWLGTGAEPVTVSLTAETVRFVGPELHFITGNTVVRSVPRAEVTALTWRGNPRRGRNSGPHRNSGVLWTEEERARLTAEVLGDLSWIEISHRHERTISAVRREAVRMRLVDEIGRRLDELPAALSALAAAPTHTTESAHTASPSPVTPLPTRPSLTPTPPPGASASSPTPSTLATQPPSPPPSPTSRLTNTTKQ